MAYPYGTGRLKGYISRSKDFDEACNTVAIVGNFSGHGLHPVARFLKNKEGCTSGRHTTPKVKVIMG